MKFKLTEQAGAELRRRADGDHVELTESEAAFLFARGDLVAAETKRSAKPKVDDE